MYRSTIPVLLALGTILVALGVVLGTVPEPIGGYAVIVLPALAAVSARPTRCGVLGRLCTKVPA